MRFAAFRSQMMQKLNDLGFKARDHRGITNKYQQEHTRLVHALGYDLQDRRDFRRGDSGHKRKVNRNKVSRMTRRRHKLAAA